MRNLDELIVGTIPKSKLESAEYIALANLDGELCIDFIMSEEDLIKFNKAAHKTTLYLRVEEEK